MCEKGRTKAYQQQHHERHFVFEVEDLPDFILRLKKGECIRSPLFKVRGKTNTDWEMVVYPNGGIFDSQNYVSLLLKVINIEHVHANVVFKCFNSKWKLINEVYRDYHESDRWGSPRMVSHACISDPANFPDRKVIFQCKVTVRDEITNGSHVETSLTQLQKNDTLSASVWETYQNQDFTDVTLKVGSEVLKCHKLILVAGSPMFKTMFSNPNMVENKTNTVEIKEYSVECVKKFVEFLYKRSVTEIEDIACELLVAADYYQVEELVQICEDQIQLKITAENVLEVLQVAEKCTRPKLISKGVECLGANRGVMETQEYENMLQNNGKLCVLITKEMWEWL